MPVTQLLRAAMPALVAVLCLSSLPSRSEAAAPGVTADRVSQFVEFMPGRSLYVDYIKPRAGQPTVVLINGLTYRTGSGCWENFAKELAKRGFGVFMWDPVGMGQTLLRDKWPTEVIDYRDQVADMHHLLDHMGLTEPLHLVGLSYGGALAIDFASSFPERISTLTLMAPFTAPLASQDLTIKVQIATTRAMFPFNPASDGELYDYFLKSLVYSTYPAAEPIVLENPYKLEATFRLAQGIRGFQAKDYVSSLPAQSVHLLIGRKDQYIDNAVHDELWRDIPAGDRLSKIYFEATEHKIPEAAPVLAANVVEMIVTHNPMLSGGRTFTASPATGTVRELDPRPRTDELSASARLKTGSAATCSSLFAVK